MQLLLRNSKVWPGEATGDWRQLLPNKMCVAEVLSFDSIAIVNFSLLYFGCIRAQQSLSEITEEEKNVN